MSGYPWNVLGIEPTRDAGVVRRAYADALRALDLDRDVAAYANLRRARDEGLWLARNGWGEDDDDAGDGGGGGDFGLGSLDDPLADDDPGFDLTSVRFSETGAGVTVPDAGLDWGGLDWGGLDPSDAGEGRFDAPPPEESSEAVERSEGEKRAGEAWNGLLAILFPDGNYSDEAITLDQLGEGMRHLNVLIARADECGIDEHHALDHALAQLMAETWPRSAPFVEPAAEAFHWLDESGQIEERPALMFLNLRLRGMRFHEKVQQPDHPLNKAWVELSRPGRARWIDRMRVRNEDVHNLLAGIRSRYPEVESYLDWERVASWENPADTSQGSKFTWVWIGIIILVGLVRVIGFATSDDGQMPPPVVTTEVRPDDGTGGGDADLARFDARIENLFGEGTTLADIRAADPVFATQLDNAITAERSGSTPFEGFVRSQAFRASSVAKFDELVALAQLKQLWMMNALGDREQCRRIMTGDLASIPPQLDRAGKLGEQALLRQLLEAGALNHLGGREASSFAVPGWMVEQMLTRTGLSEEQLGEALSDPDHPSRCIVDLALINITLEQPGRVSEDLLRGL